jgi:hypothetical protein
MPPTGNRLPPRLLTHSASVAYAIAQSSADFGTTFASRIYKQASEGVLPMYLLFTPAAFGFLAIFTISLRNQFAERSNI